MKKNFKKSLSVLLALLMTVSVFSVCAFAAGPYTVSFDAGTAEGVTGTAPADIETDANGSFKLPETATFERFGYEQTGWTTSKAGTGSSKAFGSTQTVSSDTTYYPYWTAKKSTVTYLPGSNATGDINTGTATYGSSYTFLKNSPFKREGYQQIGWSLTDGGELIYTMGEKSRTIIEDITLYPYWVPENVTAYIVTFAPGSNQHVNENTTYKRVTEDGGKIKLTDLGFSYTNSDDSLIQDGWSKESGGMTQASKVVVDEDGYYTVTKNTTLYPFWKRFVHTITYNPGEFGIGTPVTEEANHGKSYTFFDETFERNGYKQIGWSLTDGGDILYPCKGKTSSITEDITLYPYWVPADSTVYIISFGPGSNSFVNESATYVRVTENGGKIKFADLGFGYTRDDGFTQTGWSTEPLGTSDKVSVDDDGYYTATDNVTLYPYWEVLGYTITYAPGDFATGTPSTETVGHGKTFKISDALFERDEYVQTGWSLTSDGAELAYELGVTSEKVTSDITLYPYWNKLSISATISSQLLKFGYTCVDYSDVSPLDVTVKNTGNWEVKYTLPTSLYYNVTVKSGSLTLQPDETVTLSIQPKASLGENIYSEKLVVVANFAKATVEFTATFGVSEHAFVKYVSDGDATYKADGHKTATCANGCGKTDTIIDLGSMKVFSADNNDVQGLVPEYTHHRTIRFTAYGSGYDNNEPITGSKRFVPVSWYVDDDYNGEFVDGVFDVVYTHTVFGNYTLIINFVEEEYNEDTDTWTATGENDTKTFTYSVGPTAEEEQEIVMPNTILSIIFGLFAKILEMLGIGK